MKKPEPAYLLFVGLNLALVGSALALTFGREPWLLYVFALPLVLAEVRPFFRARTRWRRALVLYVAFLAFCWSFTLVDVPQRLAELRSLAGIGGLVLRGFAFVAFGHVYGLPFLPPVIAINLLVFRPAADEKPERRSDAA